MRWFLATIVYQIICGDGDHTPQFDEQVRLISSPTETEALAKANSIGKQEADLFVNVHQQLVQWKFIAVTNIHPIKKTMDGAEVFSQIKEPGDAEAFCNFVQHKATVLQQKISLTAFEII